MKKKCRILSKYKTPLPLNNAVGIKLCFPYEDGRELEKNSVTIVDAEKGLIEFELSDFEIQGLKAEIDQSFRAEVTFPQHKELVVFSKCMNISLENDRKVWK